MSEVINCDCCGGEMKLQKSGHVRTDKGVLCRLRRFVCDICDTVKTIYANGHYDDDVMEWIALDDVKKMYKQQEDYEKGF